VRHENNTGLQTEIISHRNRFASTSARRENSCSVFGDEKLKKNIAVACIRDITMQRRYRSCNLVRTWPFGDGSVVRGFGRGSKRSVPTSTSVLYALRSRSVLNKYLSIAYKLRHSQCNEAHNVR